MSDLFYSFVTCILVSFLITPVIFKLLKKLKVNQNILEYVDNHKSKSGTLSMGGLIFIIGALGAIFFLYEQRLLAILCIVIMFCYGILGFLDDFLKVKHKHNEGLKPYQKIIGQVGIATIIAFFVYKFSYLGGEINIPFSNVTIDIGWGIIPFVILFYLAVTNSVNLTDGLDGLAGYVSLVVIFSLGVMNIVKYNNLVESGVIELAKEYNSMAVICFGVCGALLVFLLFNTNPASIFMGDTGSLALGGFIASVTAFMQEYLILVLIGIMFVVSAVSDILQVFYYKATEKRIFLMAPFHHHLERKGWSEPKIVSLYVFITIIMSAATIIFNL
ncbi:MAG: phospho-N-acetylmuramoyl-pentapeptide-transferase [Clostridia bacterium]|nr:phospho-N-acetylmuramoyl-pentapeptide-transferase [Clostridia bacterium]